MGRKLSPALKSTLRRTRRSFCISRPIKLIDHSATFFDMLRQAGAKVWFLAMVGSLTTKESSTTVPCHRIVEKCSPTPKSPTTTSDTMTLPPCQHASPVIGRGRRSITTRGQSSVTVRGCHVECYWLVHCAQLLCPWLFFLYKYPSPGSDPGTIRDLHCTIQQFIGQSRLFASSGTRPSLYSSFGSIYRDTAACRRHGFIDGDRIPQYSSKLLSATKM